MLVPLRSKQSSALFAAQAIYEISTDPGKPKSCRNYNAAFKLQPSPMVCCTWR